MRHRPLRTKQAPTKGFAPARPESPVPVSVLLTMSKDTQATYWHIIDDVVTRVRTEFVQEGVDE